MKSWIPKRDWFYGSALFWFCLIAFLTKSRAHFVVGFIWFIVFLVSRLFPKDGE